MHDIIIIGAGPAGLTAAVYARRAGKSVLIIEKGTFGGQVTYSPKIENVPGFVSISGAELSDKLVEQALAQGADIELGTVASIEKTDGGFAVSTDDGLREGRAVIVAAGVTHRLLGLEREEELIGKGISFCAVCDGAFYAGRTVAVIGGGNSALQEALMLSGLCRKVYVVQNLGFLTGEEGLQTELAACANAEILLNTVVSELMGDGALCGITVRNTESGETRVLDVDGMFTAIGLKPQNDIYGKLAELEGGYIVAGEDCKTKTEGLFAAGDCRTKAVRQIATAAADGAIAALAACAYLDKKSAV